ncbi:ABC transporter permease [Romboutsia sp. 1001713B170131_170501_G6]|uniref:ABC transporter permease n=1 Tax=Romboutsia sp. 1001713B170131_170501_G6 TaxID=2787108 RepID=UPI0018A90A58|nr:ABC transporter permease [Romboutsia sp. 1001713B170131_170501_G6]
MKNIMTILKHNLKSTMKGWFWLVLIFPIAINILVSVLVDKEDSSLEDSNNSFNVGVYAKDNSEIVDKLLPLDKVGSLFVVSSEKELKETLDKGDISVGVIINSKDIYKDIKTNKEGTIEVISQSNSGNKEYILSVINTGIMQIQSFGDNKDEYLKLYKQYEKNSYKFTYENSNLSYAFPYIIMFGLFEMAFLIIGGRCIVPLLKERELKIDRRILMSKISKIEYTLGHILGCFVLLLFQGATLVATFYILNPQFDINLIWMMLLAFVLSFVVIAVALVVLSISSNSTMYYTLLSVIITPMCLLSGGFIPTEFMPESVQHLSLISPLTWINSAFKKIIMEGSYLGIGLDLLAAVSISLVLIMLYLVLEDKRKNKLTC